MEKPEKLYKEIVNGVCSIASIVDDQFDHLFNDGIKELRESASEFYTKSKEIVEHAKIFIDNRIDRLLVVLDAEITDIDDSSFDEATDAMNYRSKSVIEIEEFIKNKTFKQVMKQELLVIKQTIKEYFLKVDTVIALFQEIHRRFPAFKAKFPLSYVHKNELLKLRPDGTLKDYPEYSYE